MAQCSTLTSWGADFVIDGIFESITFGKSGRDWRKQFRWLQKYKHNNVYQYKSCHMVQPAYYFLK